MRHLIIRKSDGVAVNCIVWEEGSEWIPEEGYELIGTDDEKACIGSIWNGTSFDPDPNAPVPDPNEPPMYPN